MEYPLAADSIMEQLPPHNIISSASDRCTSINQRAITTVLAYYLDGNWGLREVQLAVDEVNGIFFTLFES